MYKRNALPVVVSDGMILPYTLPQHVTDPSAGPCVLRPTIQSKVLN